MTGEVLPTGTRYVILRNRQSGRSLSIVRTGGPTRGLCVLQLLDGQLKDAYEHADNCARRARIAANGHERDDWLFLERRCLLLARSIELRHRIEWLSEDAERHSARGSSRCSRPE
jgi:hypothetical protein